MTNHQNTNTQPTNPKLAEHQARTMTLLKACIPVFTILSDENRHKILKLLINHGKMNVNAITDNLHLSRPAVSHHLKLMLDAGMIGVEQVGKERFYFVVFTDAIDLLDELVDELRLACPLNSPLATQTP